MQRDSINVKSFSIGCIGIILFSVPTIAQEIPRFPDSIQNDNNLNFDEKLIFPTLEKVAPSPLKSQPRVPSPIPIVKVVEFQVQGNTVFSDEEIQTILEPYLGNELRDEDLGAIENAVVQYYTENDYLGVGAFISAIELISVSSSNHSIIKIQVLERVISDIQITGAKRLTPFIKKRVRKYINLPFNSNQFTNELRFLLDVETIDSIQVDFVPTELSNEGRLQMNIILGDIIALEATLNNQRSPSFGEFERGLNFVHRNLTGIGDKLNLQYRNTDGSNLTGASYEVPVNANDGSISISAFFGRTNVVREPIDQFDLDSETLRFSTAFRQPVIQKSDDSKIEEGAIGIGISHINRNESLSDIPFPLSDGSNFEGNFRSTVLNIFQDYSRKSERYAFLLRSDLDIGLPIGTSNDPSFGDGSFLKGSLQGVFLYKLNNRLSLFSRWDGQIGDRTLSSNEQYTIGGQNSVRGADLNISRDFGIDFSQEIRMLLFQSKQHRLELAPFFDIGYAANRTPQVFEKNLTIASLGIAVRYQLANRFFATFEYGQPVLGRESFRDGSDFKFSVTGRIF